MKNWKEERFKDTFWRDFNEEKPKKTGDYICILDSQSFGNMAICTWDKKQKKWTFKNWWGVYDEGIDTNQLKIKKWTPRENGIMLGCPGCGKSMTTKWKR